MTEILQQFEGLVTEIMDDTFGARLTAIIGERVGDELWAEIYTDKVPKDDRDLVVLGGCFTWSITEMESTFEFLRLPPWTQEELDAAKKPGKDLFDLFNVADGVGTVDY